MAERIQRMRKKGWRMPEGAVYVGRPSRWGNPYKVGDLVIVTGRQLGEVGHYRLDGTLTFDMGGVTVTRELAVALYELEWSRIREDGGDRGRRLREEMRAELTGHDLACFCPTDGRPCHADVLLRLANP